MKRKRHSRAEILRKVKKARADLDAGVPIDEVCLKQEVRLHTLQRWLRENHTPHPDGHARVKQLEHEIRRLRRTVANLEFDKQVLAEAALGNF
jgi:hypothetical protein